MDFIRPSSWADALAVKSAEPGALPILGGTDLMVGLNFGEAPPPTLLDLTAISELSEWHRDNGTIHLGAGVTYSRIIDELGEACPGLAIASRTVGSPQIRNRATVAGNLGTASPAGDAHPPLLATGAVVEAASVRGSRLIDINDFFLGVKRNALAPDELIRAVRIPVRTGPQQFAKVGTRNAMVIAVCTVAVALDWMRGLSAPASGRPLPPRGGRRRPSRSRQNCHGTAASSTQIWLGGSVTPWPRRRHPSMTSAARRPTAPMRCPFSVGAPCSGPGAN